MKMHCDDLAHACEKVKVLAFAEVNRDQVLAKRRRRCGRMLSGASAQHQGTEHDDHTETTSHAESMGDAQASFYSQPAGDLSG